MLTFLLLLSLYGYIIYSWLSLSDYEVLYAENLSIILITQKVKQLMVCSNELQVNTNGIEGNVIRTFVIY